MSKEGILFISDSRESIEVARRIKNEGLADTYFYCHDPAYRSNFKGIMPMVGMGELKKYLSKCGHVYIDINLPNRKPPIPRDIELLRMFGCNPASPGVFGPISDKLRKHHHVICGSQWCEKIEFDRDEGVKLAKKIGLSIPEYQEFASLRKGVEFLQSSEGQGRRWVVKPAGNQDLDLTFPETFEGEAIDILSNNLPERFKTDRVQFILQTFVEDGVELSSELWWDGKEFLHPNRTLEDKKVYSGNTGPAAGSASNTVWLCGDADGVVHKEMQKLKPYLELSGYVGPIDANCILTEDGKAWFLEWTPRCGYSALYCFLSFIPKGGLTNFFLNGFSAMMKDGFVASQVVSLYPYPSLDKKALEKLAKGNWVNHDFNDPDFWWQDVMQGEDGKLRCAGADGMIGVLTSFDEDMEEAIKKNQAKVKKLKVSGNLQYRVDHLESHSKRMNKLKNWGLPVF